MLLKEVAKINLEIAKQLRQLLEATESPLAMEDLQIRLEENERLIESLEVDSTATKAEGLKTSDKKAIYRESTANINQSAQPAEVNTMFLSALE
jgi:hypothetical protein